MLVVLEDVTALGAKIPTCSSVLDSKSLPCQRRRRRSIDGTGAMVSDRRKRKTNIADGSIRGQHMMHRAELLQCAAKKLQHNMWKAMTTTS